MQIIYDQICRFLDKAAVVGEEDVSMAAEKSRWEVCTVTQVEELKSMVRMLPVWASTIALSISFAQLSTFFIAQATLMDRTLSSFTIPTGSVPVFAALSPLLFFPLYESLAVPFLRRLTRHSRGLNSLQRIGAGLFVSVFALAAAAAVESNRRRRRNSAAPPTVFWLFPQFFLIGTAEVFAYVGQLEFFYDEATEGTRSISSAVFLSSIGIGSWLSTALVKAVERATGGEEKGWLRGDLNDGRLDYFYWLLAAINALNFVVYVPVAWRYKGRVGEPRRSASVRDVVIGEEDVAAGANGWDVDGRRVVHGNMDV